MIEKGEVFSEYFFEEFRVEKLGGGGGYFSRNV